MKKILYPVIIVAIILVVIYLTLIFAPSSTPPGFQIKIKSTRPCLAEINVSSDSISVYSNGDGTFELQVPVSVVLNETQSSDITKPVTRLDRKLMCISTDRAGNVESVKSIIVNIINPGNSGKK